MIKLIIVAWESCHNEGKTKIMHDDDCINTKYCAVRNPSAQWKIKITHCAVSKPSTQWSLNKNILDHCAVSKPSAQRRITHHDDELYHHNDNAINKNKQK